MLTISEIKMKKKSRKNITNIHQLSVYLFYGVILEGTFSALLLIGTFFFEFIRTYFVFKFCFLILIFAFSYLKEVCLLAGKFYLSGRNKEMIYFSDFKLHPRLNENMHLSFIETEIKTQYSSDV